MRFREIVIIAQRVGHTHRCSAWSHPLYWDSEGQRDKMWKLSVFSKSPLLVILILVLFFCGFSKFRGRSALTYIIACTFHMLIIYMSYCVMNYLLLHHVFVLLPAVMLMNLSSPASMERLEIYGGGRSSQ